jgi:hypothetical protein
VAVVGFGYLAGFGPDDYTHEEKIDSGRSILILCTPMILLPSIIFFIIGFRGRRKDEELKNIANMLNAYGRIKLVDLGLKFNKPIDEIERLIMKCLEENLVQGHIDVKSREFLTYHYLSMTTNERYEWKCPDCGTFNDSEKLRGDIVMCKICKKRLPIISRKVKRKI